MPMFIITGYYDWNGQSFADSQEADDALAAFSATAAEYPEVTLVQAVQLPSGECFAPCEDSGNVCDACDFPVLSEDEDGPTCCEGAEVVEVVQELGVSHWVCQECGKHMTQEGDEIDM